MQDFLNDKVRVGSQPLPTLKNIDSPYQKVSAVPNLTSQRDDIIFITSRFRSGSTLLWNLFRQSGTCTSFYEPFNERQWFSPKLRGENVDASHRGVSDYWAEYQGMEELSELYDEDWIRTELLMTEQSHQPKMKRFIERLVELSPKRPVLQFNRIDFRLLWVKQHFPKAKILHLFRHPRDQWCSFLTDDSLMNKNDVELTYQDAFYLDPWCDDLAKHYPFLDKRFTPHPYQRFYALWKLSFLFGKQYADYSVSFEALTEKPKDEINAIFDLFNISVDPFSIEKLCNVIQAPMPARWKNYADEAWFAAHENEVDNLILPFLKR
ncbi:sulfotransferase [Paraglaciecola sp.]|uniref:sulfotransferase n=1 Tax=Paraglaciecola sp. TaxID=1920173 RepID=UPI00273EE29E|nr:sulfotransferase [Paraglaciecola sp.]MDP5032260.1 sulfotransferase [Paraglaciecola sp.]